MKRTYKISFLVILIFIIIIVMLLHPIGKRIDVLKDYKQLLSDPEAVKRLESIPPIKTWKHYEADDAMSIGYADFSFPFGEIFKISNEYKRVIIDSDKAEVHFAFYVLDDSEIDLEHPEKHLPGLTYEGGTIKVRDERYQHYDVALTKYALNMPSYEFDKEIYKLSPKPLYSLFFVNFKKLYLYERLLETKNADLWGGKVFLFETDKLKGKVERLDWMEEKNNYASAYMVLVWDKKNKIYQLVQIVSYMDEITEDEIEQFVSSLSYNMEIIEANSDNIRSVILEALKDNEFYVPQLQDDSY